MTVELRTVLARLELCSTASTQAFNADGGHTTENPGGKRPPGVNSTAADWYRWRLRLLDHGRPLRVDGDHGGKTRDTHDRLLADARRELEQITGRTDRAPQRITVVMDTREGVKTAAEQDAPGKPADQIARQFGVTEFTVRRWYVEWKLDPLDGASLTDRDAEDEADLIVRAREMARRGMTQKQIAMRLGKSQPTVSRYLRRAA